MVGGVVCDHAHLLDRIHNRLLHTGTRFASLVTRVDENDDAAVYGTVIRQRQSARVDAEERSGLCVLYDSFRCIIIRVHSFSSDSCCRCHSPPS